MIICGGENFDCAPETLLFIATNLSYPAKGRRLAVSRVYRKKRIRIHAARRSLCVLNYPSSGRSRKKQNLNIRQRVQEYESFKGARLHSLRRGSYMGR